MRTLVLLAVIALTRGQDEICCQEPLGCFQRSDCHEDFPLPECPRTDGSDNQPNFQLFDRANQNNGREITRDNIGGLEFDGSKRTVFVTHGWWGNWESGWMQAMKDDILDSHDNNVITMGWGAASVDIDYWQAASSTRTGGAEAAYIASLLMQQKGLAASNIWCMGHSLGGHFCGHFGKAAQTKFGFTPGRVTGLDPAGPWFDGESRLCGLTDTDATWVDTIITDKGGLGTDESRGKADFFPNGNDGDHGVCISYMRESMSPACRFNARQSCSDVGSIPGSCSDCGGVCQVMGEPSGSGGNTQRGMFHLTTNYDGGPPYCQG